MKFKICLLLVAMPLFNCYSQTLPLYVGTYTKGESKGIYRLDFNTKTGELSNKQLAVATRHPSFIAYAPNKKYIYAVGETIPSIVSAFKVKDDGKLEFLNSENSNGKNPCHVSINESGNKAVVSNYGAGTVSIYSINKNGSLNKNSQIFNQNKGEKPARAHSAQFHNNDLYVADLGNNTVFQYTLKDDNYVLKSDGIVKMNGNPGPRHFAVTKDGKYIYIINEYGGSITSVKRTKSRFKTIDEDSTLDKNYSGKNSCADIHLSNDERFLYGSNRGENTIAVFKRHVKTGTIEKIQSMPVHGDWPRNFTLDPTGQFMLVANQRSENISIFKIDSETGKLSFLNSIDLPNPVCLLF